MTGTLEEALLRHFTSKKLEMAYAIHKPFPFIESLRDSAFISESLYRESLEACRHLVPVAKVIYNILTKLEKTFNLSLLEMLFHPLHLYEYPNLKMSFKSFKNVASSHGGWSRLTPVLKALPDAAEGSSCQTRLLPLPPPPPLPQRPPGSLQPGEPAASQPPAAAQRRESLGEQPSPAGPALAPCGSNREERLAPDNVIPRRKHEDSAEQPCSPPDALQGPESPPDALQGPESPPDALQGPDSPPDALQGPDSPPNTLQASGSPPDALQGPGSPPDALQGPESPPDATQAAGEDALEPDDVTEPHEAAPASLKTGEKRKRSSGSTPRKTRHKKRPPQGGASPGHGHQESVGEPGQAPPRKEDAVGQPRMVTRAQKARAVGARTPRLEDLTGHENKVSSDQLSGKKQKRRKRYSWSSPKKRQKRRLPGGQQQEQSPNPRRGPLRPHSAGWASLGRGRQEKVGEPGQAPPRKKDAAGQPRMVTRAQKARAAGARTPRLKVSPA